MNFGIGADANQDEYEPVKTKPVIEKSEALSMQNTIKDSIKTRRIAFLVADGVDGDSVSEMKTALMNEGAIVRLIAPKLGFVQTNGQDSLSIDGSFLTDASVLYDAVFIPSGSEHLKNLIKKTDSIHFINEAYRHCKAIATGSDGEEFLNYTYINTKENGKDSTETGVLVGANPDEFVQAIAQHRFWDREMMRKVPA
jgi:catalase